MTTAGILPRRRLKFVVLLAAGVAIGGVLAANFHLVYVAFQSQPDCVAHLKTSGGENGFRAAKSAC